MCCSVSGKVVLYEALEHGLPFSSRKVKGAYRTDARSLYGRIFAAGYEHWTRAAERAGLRDERERMLAGLHGDVVEIGPGPGLNFPVLPDAVATLTLAEPEDAMAARLDERFAQTGRAGRADPLAGRGPAAGGRLR